MYIFKNALTNIRRNKGRNILIGIIIIVISISCTISLAIRQSASNIVNAYEEKNALSASIEMNREALMKYLKDGEKTQEQMIEAFNNIKNVTEEEILNYGNSEYVKDFYYIYNLNVNAKDINEATDSLVKETTEVKTETSTKTRTRRFNGTPPSFRPDSRANGGSQTTTTTQKKTTTTTTQKIFNEKAENGAFTLIGYNSYEDMKEFINGQYKILSGEVSSDFQSDNCVISEELATLNSLEIGNVITVIDPQNEKNTYSLNITGIYKENSDVSSSMNSMFTNSANNIITNTNFIKKILETNTSLNSIITPTFLLKNKNIINDFEIEVNEKGLSEYYKVSNNLSEIESATEVINNVKIFATTFLIMTLLIGGIVLTIINMINIRERKYEIGVLRTIGMKKVKVSLQFVLELLIVCIISLLIGFTIGAFSSVKVSNLLLDNEIKNANSKYEDIGKNFGIKNELSQNNNEQTVENTQEKEEVELKEENIQEKKYNFGIVNINEVESIDAIVDFVVLFKVLIIGIGITLFSSFATMISISRFSPLTILKERS